METQSLILTVFFLGAAAGAAGAWVFHRLRFGKYQQLVNEIVQRSELEAEQLRQSAEFEIKQQQVDQQRKFEQNWQQERQKVQKEDTRLKQREDKLETRLNLFEKKVSHTEKKEEALITKKEKLDDEKKELQNTQKKLLHQLEKVSGLTSNEAREMIINRLTQEMKSDAANLIRRTKKEAEEEADSEARKIIVMAINRLAVPCVSEATVNTVSLPTEDLKGRIIGREGRNIRALERATGINFIIDDTPGAIVLSGFDPIRLHVAKIALTELVMDGRIHPTRIEEAVEKAKQNVTKKIREYGEDAALRTNQMNLHPEILNLLGGLKFRYSYGQNVLDHSIEVSHLMGMIAAELHLDINLAKRIGILHDIGKAVSHEIEGTHAVIGHDFALRYGETPEVATGIGSHHNEMQSISIEGSFCGAADAISASRPGARIEAVESYIKRLKRLEDIAYEFPGIDKAYAMQAGREICIVVVPDMIDDDATINLARDLKKRIEKDLKYPGKIKVTVIREKRAVEYAM